MSIRILHTFLALLEVAEIAMATWSACFTLVHDDIGVTTEQKVRAAMGFLQKDSISTVKIDKSTGVVSGIKLADFSAETISQDVVYMIKSFVEYVPEARVYGSYTKAVLAGPVDVGSRIFLTFTPHQNCNSFIIDLKDSSTTDVALRLRVEFVSPTFRAKVRFNNSIIDNVALPGFPFEPDKMTRLAVVVKETHMQIEVNGEYFYNFTHRLSPTIVNTITIKDCHLLVSRIAVSLRVDLPD